MIRGIFSFGRWSPRFWDWPLVIVSSWLLGTYEGSLYTAAGPHLPLAAFWALMSLILLLPLVGFLGLRKTIAFAPLALLIQDLASLNAQLQAPSEAHWYAAVFGDHVLTQHIWFLPGWYYVCFFLSVAGDYVTDRTEVPRSS